VISAIFNVILAIVDGIVWILLSIWDFLLDIICCRCGSRRRVGRRTYSRRRRAGATTRY
ncbi:hypothetical protein DL93DRAFT_2073008, partial [Clavulina sp. PMI_390]